MKFVSNEYLYCHSRLIYSSNTFEAKRNSNFEFQVHKWHICANFWFFVWKNPFFFKPKILAHSYSIPTSLYVLVVVPCPINIVQAKRRHWKGPNWCEFEFLYLNLGKNGKNRVENNIFVRQSKKCIPFFQTGKTLWNF